MAQKAGEWISYTTPEESRGWCTRISACWKHNAQGEDSGKVDIHVKSEIVSHRYAFSVSSVWGWTGATLTNISSASQVPNGQWLYSWGNGIQKVRFQCGSGGGSREVAAASYNGWDLYPRKVRAWANVQNHSGFKDGDRSTWIDLELPARTQFDFDPPTVSVSSTNVEIGQPITITWAKGAKQGTAIFNNFRLYINKKEVYWGRNTSYTYTPRESGNLEIQVSEIHEWYGTYTDKRSAPIIVSVQSFRDFDAPVFKTPGAAEIAKPLILSWQPSSNEGTSTFTRISLYCQEGTGVPQRVFSTTTREQKTYAFMVPRKLATYTFYVEETRNWKGQELKKRSNEVSVSAVGRLMGSRVYITSPAGTPNSGEELIGGLRSDIRAIARPYQRRWEENLRLPGKMVATDSTIYTSFPRTKPFSEFTSPFLNNKAKIDLENVFVDNTIKKGDGRAEDALPYDMIVCSYFIPMINGSVCAYYMPNFPYDLTSPDGELTYPSLPSVVDMAETRGAVNQYIENHAVPAIKTGRIEKDPDGAEWEVYEANLTDKVIRWKGTGVDIEVRTPKGNLIPNYPGSLLYAYGSVVREQQEIATTKNGHFQFFLPCLWESASTAPFVRFSLTSRDKNGSSHDLSMLDLISKNDIILGEEDGVEYAAHMVRKQLTDVYWKKRIDAWNNVYLGTRFCYKGTQMPVPLSDVPKTAFLMQEPQVFLPTKKADNMDLVLYPIIYDEDGQEFLDGITNSSLINEIFDLSFEPVLPPQAEEDAKAGTFDLSLLKTSAYFLADVIGAMPVYQIAEFLKNVKSPNDVRYKEILRTYTLVAKDFSPEEFGRYLVQQNFNVNQAPHMSLDGFEPTDENNYLFKGHELLQQILVPNEDYLLKANSTLSLLVVFSYKDSISCSVICNFGRLASAVIEQNSFSVNGLNASSFEMAHRSTRNNIYYMFPIYTPRVIYFDENGDKHLTVLTKESLGQQAMLGAHACIYDENGDKKYLTPIFDYYHQSPSSNMDDLV